MKVITGGVTAAKGFEAAGAEAGIKYKNRKDMAIVYSRRPCVLAGTFTSNVVKAAPVLWDKKVVEESPFGQAVIINAGIEKVYVRDDKDHYREIKVQDWIDNDESLEGVMGY